MAARKNPVLLRRSPLTDRITVLTRYTRRDGIIEAGYDGKAVLVRHNEEGHGRR